MATNRDQLALAQLLEENSESESESESNFRSDSPAASVGEGEEEENSDVDAKVDGNTNADANVDDGTDDGGDEDDEGDDTSLLEEKGRQQEERKGSEVEKLARNHETDEEDYFDSDDSLFEDYMDSNVTPETIDNWYEEIKPDNDTVVLTWEKRLDLWSEKLRAVDYEDLVFEPVSALSKLKRYTWLGLAGRGQVGYACLRWLGGKLVARKRQNNDGSEYECVITEENLVSMLEDSIGESDSMIVSVLRKLEERHELSNLLEELRGCKPDELLHRLRDEAEFGFIIPMMRLRVYDPSELSAFLRRICDSELSKVCDKQTSSCLEDIKRKLDDDGPDQRAEWTRHLLDATIDKFQRNKRVFFDALRRSVTQTQENGNEVVFVDPRHGAKLTPLDKWHRDSLQKGSAQPQAAALSLKRRLALVKAEKKWFDRTRPIVNAFVQAILPDSGEPDIFNLLNRKDEKLAMEEGTSKDTFTPKLRQYCSKKQRLMDLREASALSSCLTAAQDPHIETRDQADGEAERIVLVIGYRAFSEHGARLASGNEAPFVSRCLSVTDDDAGEKITEVGARLDGLYSRIPDELCEVARDKIFNSVLPIREERDTLVFYEFVPTGVHAADSSPLERIFAEPPQLAVRTSRAQHDGTSAITQLKDPTTPRSPTPGSMGSRENAMVRSLVSSGDSFEGHDGFQQHRQHQGTTQHTSQHIQARHFTHILLEMDSTPSKEDDVRRKEHSAYRSLEESCERRFLISLSQPGKVEVEGMRLPSLAVLPRSSVAPNQDNLSFRRYLVLLPATYLDFDTTLSERHELAGLLHRYAKTAYVETAETLAQVLSIFISVKEKNDAVPPVEIVYEKLKSNQLILNCMSVTSLVSVAPEIFKGPVHEVWESILTPHDTMSIEELAAREAALALITGRSSGAPATAVLATDDMWGHLHDLLSSRTKFSCEDLDVEPSNFWSIADRLSRRAEMSVSTFYFVRLTGRTNSGMLEKLLGVASESRCVKLIFYFTKGLMALYNRLSADIRPRVFLHEMVTERAKEVSPVISTESDTVYDGLLHSVSRELIHSPSFAARTIDRIQHQAAQAADWAQHVQDSLRVYHDDAGSVRKNTCAIVTEDPEALTSTLLDKFSRLDFLNARDPRCIEKLRGLLSQGVSDTEDEPMVLVLLHAQLLVRDRLQVIASHCARCQKPLLLVVNAATRDLTSFQTTSIDGTTTFEHVDIFHARTRLPSRNQSLYRVLLGLRILLGPHLDINSDKSHVQSLSAFLEDEDTANVPPFLSEFALRLASQVPLLHRMLRTLASNTKPESVFTYNNESGETLLGDVVASVLWTYIEELEDVTKIVHFSDVANDPAMFLAPQALRVWAFIACLEGETTIRPKCALEGRLNISRTDNPGEILCSTLNSLRDDDIVISTCQESYYVDPGRGDSMTPLGDIIEQTAIRGGDLHWNEVYRSWVRTPEVSTPILLHLLQEAPSRLLLALSLSKTRMASLPLPDLVVQRLSQDLYALRKAITGPREEEATSRVAAELQHRIAALAWSILKHQAARPSALSTGKTKDDFPSLVRDFLRSDLHFDFKSGNGEDRNLEQRLIEILMQIDDPSTALLKQPKVAEVILSSSEKDQRIVRHVVENTENLVMGAALLNLCLHSSWREKLAQAADVLFLRLEPLVKWAVGSTAMSLFPRLERIRSTSGWHQQLSPAAMAEVLVRGAASHPNNDKDAPFPRFVCDHVLQAILAHREVDAQISYIHELVQAIASSETRLSTNWDRFNVCLRTCAILRSETLSNDTSISQVLENWLSDITASVYKFSLLSVARNKFMLEELQAELGLDLVASPVMLRLYVEFNASDAAHIEIEIMKSRHYHFFPTQRAREALLTALTRFWDNQTQKEPSRSLLVLAWFAWAANPAYNLAHALLPTGSEQWNDFSCVMRDNVLRDACNSGTEPLSLLATFVLMPHTLAGESLNSLISRFQGNQTRPSFKSTSLVLAQQFSDDFPLYALRVEPDRFLPAKCISHVFGKIRDKSLHPPQKWNKKLGFPRVQEGFFVSTVEHNVRLLIHLDIAMAALKYRMREAIAHTGMSLLAWFVQVGVEPEDLASLIKRGSVDEKLEKVIRTVQQLGNDARRANMFFVHCPLPVVLDGRFVDEMGSTADSLFDKLSKSITMQQVFLLANTFETSSKAGSSGTILAERTHHAKSSEDYIPIVKDLFLQIGKYFAHSENVEWEKLRAIGGFLLGLRKKKTLSEIAFKSFAEGLDTTSKGRDHLPEIVDGLYIVLGLTPLTDGETVKQMISEFASFQWSGDAKPIFMSTTCKNEIDWMSRNVFTGIEGDDLLGENVRALNSMVKQYKSKDVRRDLSTTETVSTYVGEDFITRLEKALRFPNLPQTPREDRDSMLDDKYDICLVGKILPYRNGPLAADKAPPEVEEGRTDAQVSATFDEGVEESGDVLTSPSLTQQSSQDVEDDQLALNVAISLQKAADGAVSRGPSLVSARTLLRVKCEPSYGVLEVAPGLHPVLRKPEDQEDEDPMRYVRHSPFSFDGDLGAEAGIAHVFANNGETWELFQDLPNNSTILGRGFYLRKTQQGTWVMLMATTRSEERDCPQLFLHTIVETHRLAAFNFQDEVVAVLECLVQVAFAAGLPQMEAPSSVKEMIKKIKVLQRSEDLIPRKQNEISESDDEEESHDDGQEDREDGENEDDNNIVDLEAARHPNEVASEDLAQSYTSYKEAELRHVTWMLQQLNDVREKAGDHTIVSGIAKKLEMASPEIQVQLSKALTVIMTTTDHEARSQLYFVLELVQHNLNLSSGKYSPDPALKNKLMAMHAHIAKHNFRSIGLQLLDEFDRVYAPSGVRVFTMEFEDSDDEDDAAGLRLQPVKEMRAGSENDGVARKRVEEACKTISGPGKFHDADDGDEAETTEGKESNLFDYNSGGYGEVRDSNRTVWTLHGSEPGRCLYFCPLDTRQLKLQYSDAHGLPIAYIFHERLLTRALHGREPSEAADHCDRLLDWLGKLARSPLPVSTKRFMMATLEHGAPSCVAPALTRHGVTFNKSEGVDEDEDVNLLAIANCVAAAMPREEAVREQLTRVYTIKPGMRKFIKRKNDMYGVHVVRRQEWETLGRHGIVPVECDLGHNSLINARDDASMYLRIIGCFSEFTWLVWVRGLPTVSDQLLKWIAEYTKHHPWRFVYLEDCDTSWNFGENRDRCVLTRAPKSASRLLTCKKDLQRAQLRANRPVHEFDVDGNLIEIILSALEDWKSLETTLKAALLPGTQVHGDSDGMQSRDENVVIDFLKDSMPAPSPEKDGVRIGPGVNEESTWLSAGGAHESRSNDDYRERMKELLKQPDPRIVLLVSPPGAGKSHFSDELGKELTKELSLGKAYVDGSDDELVDTALASVLTRKVPEEGGRMFLVVDEYHMLSGAHKQELFAWLAGQQSRLYVLLIANRKDASDDSLLEPLNAQAVNARLPVSLLNVVIKKRKGDVKKPLAIKLWFHLSRALFGGESISLRILNPVDEALSAPDKAAQLLELLCKKMPRLSTLTAQEFVDAYLIAEKCLPPPQIGALDPPEADASLACKLFEEVGKRAKTVTGAMVQAALLTWDNDVGRDFPDFVERDLRGANGVSPAMKIAAWCCMMRAESKKRVPNASIPPDTIFKTFFIDQVGFPHQLSDRASLTNRKCPTFSWGGSYESLQDMSDALRRGHSINFTDVYEKEWRENEVVALNEFVVLLSACRSPATVLRAVRRENLVALLQGSLSDDALKLAKYILTSGVFEKDADSHGHYSPYRAAAWTLLMCETEPIDVKELVQRFIPRDELVKALAWAPDNVASLRATRAKDRGLRQRTLTYLLVGLSKWLVKGNNASQVHLLWRGFLAPLLDPAKHPDVAEVVAKYEDDLQVGWVLLMRKLWLLAKGRAQTADLTSIKTIGKGALYKPQQESFRVSYATGMLLSTSSIPLEDQHTLLQAKGSEVDLEFLLMHRVSGNLDLNDLIQDKFREAIETYRSKFQTTAQLVTIEIKPDSLRESIKSAITKQE